MNLTSVIVPPAASGSSAPPTLDVLSRLAVEGVPGRFVYRRELRLRFRLGSGDKPVFERAATRLGLVLARREYDARSPPSPLPAAQVSTLAGKVLVTLDAPREIKSITLTTGLTPALAAAPLGLYRVDRTAPADKPAVVSSVGVTLRPFPAGFLDQRFCVAAEGAPGLTPANISSVTVIACPASPRAAVIIPGEDPEGRRPFWQAPGRFDAPGGPAALSIDIGPDLADALARAAEKTPVAPGDGLGAGGGTLTVPLVIESDEPCSLTVSSIDIAFSLTPGEEDSGEGGRGKIVLRFPGGAAASRGVALRVPAGAAVTAARLHVTESFASAARAPGAEQFIPATHAAGVMLEPRVRAAQRIELVSALEAWGVAIPAIAVAGAPTLTVALEIAEGPEPSGRKIASASVALALSDGARWLSLLFPRAVLLDTSPKWLAVSVADGECVWLGEESPGALPLLVRAGADAGWRPPALAGAFRFLTAGGEASEAPALRAAAGAFTVPALAAGGGDGSRVYDAAAALNSALAARPGEKPEVTFTTMLRGIVSIGRIDLRYDRA